MFFFFPKVFSLHFCHLLESEFLLTVTSGLLSWEHLIFSNNIALNALTLLDES